MNRAPMVIRERGGQLYGSERVLLFLWFVVGGAEAALYWAGYGDQGVGGVT